MRRPRRLSGAGLLAALALLCVAATAQAQPGITLQAGDIIVLDISADSVEHIRIDEGTGAVTKTRLASGADLKSGRGVAFSPEGLIYVADTFNDRIFRIDPDSGETVFVASIDAIGFPDPAAMIADEASGWDLLLAEADDPRILRIDPTTGLVSTEFALTGTRFPIGLTRDPTDGTLIVADRFSDDIDELAGVHRVHIGNNLQTSVSLQPEFESLRRVGVQSDGDIIVSDHDTSTVHRIPISEGSNVPEPGGFGVCGSTFNGPNGIAVYPAQDPPGEFDDYVLVTDRLDGTLYRLDSDGGDCELIDGSFAGPWEVAIVPALTTRRHESFLVSDSGTDQVYLADSTDDSQSPVEDGGFPLSVFNEPIAMAWTDPTDPGMTLQGCKVPTTAECNAEIYVIDTPTTIVRRNLETGVQDLVSENDLFTGLSDIAVDFAGDIIVTDTDGQVIRVDPNGDPSGNQTILTDVGELGEPIALVIDADGSLIVVDRAPVADVTTDEFDSGLFRVNPLNGDVEQITVVAGSGTIEFNDPVALARDPRIGLLLLDRGDGDGLEHFDDPLGEDLGKIKSPRLFRILDSEFFGVVDAFALATSIDDSLDTATAMAVDGNRDPIVAFATAEPVRIEPLTGAGTTLTVGGDFVAVTDLLIEGMPAPGEPIDVDVDDLPIGFDNCPDVYNPDQADANFDGQGDLCQLGDLDLDGYPDSQDNCQFHSNPERTCVVGLVGAACLADIDCFDPGPGICEADICTSGLVGEDCSEDADCDDTETEFCGSQQFDGDEDGIGDACDNCPLSKNVSQADFNGDGIGDACDDSDGDGVDDGTPDGVSGSVDNCPGVPNLDQADGDGDASGDVCDNCPTDFNPDQSNLNVDDEGTGPFYGDVCEPGDSDDDGWPDDPAPPGVPDNCPTNSNPGQEDFDDDGTGDVCDDADGDGVVDAIDNCLELSNSGQADSDGDFTGDDCDNCPTIFNPDQSDVNEDGAGDFCQDDLADDSDNDGWPDAPAPPGVPDNCVDTYNPSQSDVNEDGTGDACQPGDLDNDGMPDADDNCPNAFNPSQGDVNGDAVDGVGNGDACQIGDSDGDGWPDTADPPALPDNCPYFPNPDQDDWNDDGVGDLCQNSDGEGFTDFFDTCPGIENPDQADEDADLAGDVCDNCLSIPNGRILGTCFEGDDDGTTCISNADCETGAPGVCQMNQEDQDDDDVGDVCDPTPLPEPGGTLMLMSGLGGLALLARRRGRRAMARA